MGEEIVSKIIFLKNLFLSIISNILYRNLGRPRSTTSIHFLFGPLSRDENNIISHQSSEIKNEKRLVIFNFLYYSIKDIRNYILIYYRAFLLQALEDIFQLDYQDLGKFNDLKVSYYYKFIILLY